MELYPTIMTNPPRIENLNRDHFDNLAAQYNKQPWQKQLTARVTAEIHDQLDFILGQHAASDVAPTANVKRDLRLLDYACGPGMITRALGSRCCEAVGIDLSTSMAEEYRNQADSYPIPGLRTSVTVGNLFTEEIAPELDDPQFYNFDVAAVGFGFHHFASQDMCIRRLAERLKPGGTILVVDFCEEGGKLTAKAGVTAHGFGEETMTRLFSSQDLTHIGYHRILGEFEMHVEDKAIRKSVFLARASKAL